MRTFCYTLLAIALMAAVFLSDLLLERSGDRKDWSQFGSIAICGVAWLLWHDRRRTDDE